MKKIRYGIVGCGFFGSVHAKELKKIKNAELISVYSRSGSSAKNLSLKVGCEYNLNLNDLMKNQGVFFTGEQSRPAGSWLYVITWFHWIHALAGVIVLLVASIRSSKGFFTGGNILQFKLSSQFWHFLGFLWIYLLLFLTFLR